MNDYFPHTHYTSSQEYEAQLTRRYHEREMRRLLQRPGVRARFAAFLRYLAERVDQHTAPLHPELHLTGLASIHPLQVGDERASQTCLKCA